MVRNPHCRGKLYQCWKVIGKVKLSVYLLCVFSLIVLVISTKSSMVADFVAKTVSYNLRLGLTSISNIFGFSIGEFLIGIAPIVFCISVIFTIGRIVKSKDKISLVLVRYFSSLAVCLSLVVIVFVFTLGVNYHISPFYEAMGIERKYAASAEEYEELGRYLLAEMNLVLEDGNFKVDETTGETIMPYSFDELSKKLNESYKNLVEEHDLHSYVYGRVKPLIASRQISFLEITGVYLFYAGEATVATTGPGYKLPYTAAHELAHLNGIAPEDQANTVALMVCLNSDDPFIRYSGLMEVYYTVVGRIDCKETRAYLRDDVDSKTSRDREAYSSHKDEFADATVIGVSVSRLSHKVNNSYLKSQGQTEGTVTYSMFTRIAIPYLLQYVME